MLNNYQEIHYNPKSFGNLFRVADDKHPATGCYLSYADLNKIETDHIHEIWKESARRTEELKIQKEHFAAEKEELLLQIEDLEASLAAANDAYCEALEEAEKQKELNKNLIRITRERANGDRGLKEKKAHSGYVVLLSQERAKVLGDNEIIYWETTIQTPYSAADFQVDEVRELVSEDLGAHGGCVSIGITNRHFNFSELYQDQDIAASYNTVFSFLYRANIKQGYWELLLCHTLPLISTEVVLDVKKEEANNTEQ